MRSSKSLSKIEVLRSAIFGGCAFVPAHGRGFYKLEMCKQLADEGLLCQCPVPADLLNLVPADTPAFRVTEAGREAVDQSQVKVTASFMERVAKFLQTAGVSVELAPMTDELRGWLMEETIWDIPYGALLGGPSATVALAKTGSRYVLFEREKDGEWNKEGVLVYDNGRWSSHSPSARTVSLGDAVALAAKTLAQRRLQDKRRARVSASERP